MEREKAKQAVFDTLDVMNKLRGRDKRRAWDAESKEWYLTVTDPLFEKREDLILVGKGREMTSMDLVEFISVLEKELAKKGKFVRITDDRAFSVHKSPFRSIRTVIDVVVELTR